MSTVSKNPGIFGNVCLSGKFLTYINFCCDCCSHCVGCINPHCDLCIPLAAEHNAWMHQLMMYHCISELCCCSQCGCHQRCCCCCCTFDDQMGALQPAIGLSHIRPRQSVFCMQMVRPDGEETTFPPPPGQHKAALLCAAFRAGAEVRFCSRS